jgi:site-specific recombinase XerD
VRPIRRCPDGSAVARSGGYIFETERGIPFTTDAVNHLIKHIGERAGFPFKVHVHMLRHACGYALANAGMTLGQFKIGLVMSPHSMALTNRTISFR